MTFKFIPGQTVEVPEIPFKDAVTLSAAETAVVVVDMQNDFVKEGGSLVVPSAAETIPHIQQLLAAARRRGVRIAYTQDTQVPDDPEFEVWPQHVLQGTWGWQIIDELQPQPQDLIAPKNRYDGFYGSWLDHFLTRIWRVRNLVIVGTVANICVLHTAAAAGLRYFHIVLPANGVSALNEFDQALTLRQVGWLYRGSVVRSTADIQFD